jgi:predicted AAA+ superfamily ATPase
LAVYGGQNFKFWPWRTAKKSNFGRPRRPKFTFTLAISPQKCYFQVMQNELKSVISEQIADNQTRTLHSYSPRELQIEALDGVVTIVMGVRRCGKSTLMETIMEKLIQDGVPRENIVWLNFSDERLLPLHQGGWDTIHDAYYSTYPEKRRTEK